MGGWEKIKNIDNLDSTLANRWCSNCQKLELEYFIHPNGLCVKCQLIKDKRLKKRIKNGKIFNK